MAAAFLDCPSRSSVVSPVDRARRSGALAKSASGAMHHAVGKGSWAFRKYRQGGQWRSRSVGPCIARFGAYAGPAAYPPNLNVPDRVVLESNSIGGLQHGSDPGLRYIGNALPQAFDLSGTQARTIGNARSIQRERKIDTTGTGQGPQRPQNHRVGAWGAALNLSNLI